MSFTRITRHQHWMHGAPCIRGLSITVSEVLTKLAEGQTRSGILSESPDLTPEDITECLRFAAEVVRAFEWVPVE